MDQNECLNQAGIYLLEFVSGHFYKGSGSMALAKEYGVSYRTILKVASGEIYADVTN